MLRLGTLQTLEDVFVESKHGPVNEEDARCALALMASYIITANEIESLRADGEDDEVAAAAGRHIETTAALNAWSMHYDPVGDGSFDLDDFAANPDFDDLGTGEGRTI